MAAMHAPTMEPIAYLAGVDHKLAEFRGWDLATLEARPQRLTIQKIGTSGWYVMDGDSCTLIRMADGLIIFAFGLRGATASPTAEGALAFLAEYLNQPLNPYAWLRDNAD